MKRGGENQFYKGRHHFEDYAPSAFSEIVSIDVVTLISSGR
jgi:hypothetical protein